MGVKKAVQGDTIGSLAYDAKVPAAHVWNLPGNRGELRTIRKRTDPNLLLPDDPVDVPAPRVNEVSKPDAKRYRFKRKFEKAKLLVRLLDGHHKPHKNMKCEVELDGKKLPDITTDGDGKIEIKDIPPNSKVCKLTYQGRTALLHIGHLDPVETPSGHLARLKNLMYIAPEVESKIAADSPQRAKLIRDAAKVFQSQYRKSKTDGTVDQETQDKLKEIYGC